jgi:hypothetical protein
MYVYMYVCVCMCIDVLWNGPLGPQPTLKCDKPDRVSRHSDRWDGGQGWALIQSATGRSALFIHNLKHVFHRQLK